VSVAGDVDLASRAELEGALLGEVRAGAHRLVVDLSGVEFLDCTGLSALVCTGAACAAHGCALRLVGAHGMVMRVLELTGLDKTLNARG